MLVECLLNKPGSPINISIKDMNGHFYDFVKGEFSGLISKDCFRGLACRSFTLYVAETEVDISSFADGKYKIEFWEGVPFDFAEFVVYKGKELTFSPHDVACRLMEAKVGDKNLRDTIRKMALQIDEICDALTLTSEN